jgi:lycopene cyclase domain-containing protein
MSYVVFLVLFVLIPSAGLLLLLKGRGLEKTNPGLLRWHWKGTAILAAIAFLWTTPWDNYIVAQGVWSYGADRVLAVIGYVPLEEYGFFILMPLFNSALFACLFLEKASVRSGWREGQIKSRLFAFAIGAVLMALAAKLHSGESYTYLSAILLWFVPPLVLQWVFDPQALLNRLGVLLPATLLPTLYFSVVDGFAIQQGIWTIHAATRTGLEMGLLPVEEACFFFITSLLLAQGLILWHSLRQV